MSINLFKKLLPIACLSLSNLVAAPTAEEKLSPKQLEQKAALRIKNFTMPKGMTAKLWAASTQVQNPASIYWDSLGRLFVTEIFRGRNGVEDIRYYKNMLEEDIAIQSSADRIAMYKNHSSEKPLSDYTKASDRIRLLEDTNGDGRADKSTIFADGFNDILDGPGMGVIERDGKIYYTNIPHLWVLEDTNGDGVSDKRKSLQDGFGIRMSFSGHDMHGMVWGPDGKLYWTIGDRGYSFITKEGKKIHGPNDGAAFRCNADGSDLEVFYDRLRMSTLCVLMTRTTTNISTFL